MVAHALFADAASAVVLVTAHRGVDYELVRRHARHVDLIPADERDALLREFRRRHELSPTGEDDAEAEADLRDEIEAEIEAAALEEAEEDRDQFSAWS